MGSLHQLKSQNNVSRCFICLNQQKLVNVGMWKKYVGDHTLDRLFLGFPECVPTNFLDTGFGIMPTSAWGRSTWLIDTQQPKRADLLLSGNDWHIADHIAGICRNLVFMDLLLPKDSGSILKSSHRWYFDLIMLQINVALPSGKRKSLTVDESSKVGLKDLSPAIVWTWFPEACVRNWTLPCWP